MANPENDRIWECNKCNDQIKSPHQPTQCPECDGMIFTEVNQIQTETKAEIKKIPGSNELLWTNERNNSNSTKPKQGKLWG